MGASGNMTYTTTSRLFWTPERVELLRQWWAVEGLTGSEIARRLKSSKSAVIGQAHKQGFKQARSPEQKIKDKHRAGQMAVVVLRGKCGVKPQDIKPAEVPLALPAPSPKVTIPLFGRGVGFVNAKVDMCHFPLWEPSVKIGYVCGRKVWGGSPYCQAHHRLCSRTILEIKNEALIRKALYSAGR